ncbi:MAG TPA: GNA1162 family protein, partial [Candidatus Brocadiaceae bacterium]
VFSILSIVLICSGCKTISTSTINVGSEAQPTGIKTLAVMRFDDQAIQGKQINGVLSKTIINPDAGEIVAEIMTGELQKWKRYQVLTRPEIRNVFKKGNVQEAELVNAKDYVAIRKMLQVDTVVLGKISKLEVSDMKIYARGNVSFIAECIDTKNGKVLWSMNIDESAPYKDEVELAGKAIKEAIQQVRLEAE